MCNMCLYVYIYIYIYIHIHTYIYIYIYNRIKPPACGPELESPHHLTVREQTTQTLHLVREPFTSKRPKHYTSTVTI